MSCPDCDPDGFKAQLLAAYGPPIVMNGIAFYANPNMPEWAVLSPDQWARALCPKCYKTLFKRETAA